MKQLAKKVLGMATKKRAAEKIVQLDPQSLTAERCYLWLAVQDNTVLDKNPLPPAAFHDRRHRYVNEAMQAQRAAGREVIDYLSVIDQLRTEGKVNGDGTLEYLSDLLLDVGFLPTHSPKNAAEIIIEKYRRREEIADTKAKLAGLEDGTIPVPVEEEAEPEFNCTDTGNAELFAHHHRDQALFCPRLEKWFIWDGQRFRVDIDLRRFDLAGQSVRRLYMSAAKAPGRKARTERAEHALSSESRARIEAMLHLARPKCRIALNMLDSDPMLLNVQNGTVDLRTGDLQPHDPADRLTKMAGTQYNPDAKCPTWQAHLDLVFNNCKELIDYFRRYVGYTLTGLNTDQPIFFLYGNGLNGKSVTVNVISKLLSEYSVATRAETLCHDRNTGGPSNDLAALVGSRMVTIAEGLKGRSLNADLVKMVTGGDKITARFLYQESFEFTAAFKIFWSTNHLPRITDNTESIWRRVRLIPFTEQIPAEIRDTSIEVRLAEELPGILNWALEGCLRWQEKGLDPPEVVQLAVGGYRADEDPIAGFLEECAVIGQGLSAKASELYSAYGRWAEEAGERPVKAKTFSNLLRERSFDKERKSHGMVYLGIELRS